MDSQKNKVASINRTPPAEGERGASLGLRNQHRVSASVILRALKNQTLEWIRIADPLAGKVDDFQIGTPSRVDAYQMKWSVYTGAITYRQLTKTPEDGQSLIKQLSDGRERLKKLYPEKRVVVHLVTNDYASTSDSSSLTYSGRKPTPFHFAAFIEQAWNRAQESGVSDVPKEWQPLWNDLQESSGLSEEQFLEFIQNCEFEFGYKLPDLEYITTGASAIEHIAQTLFATVADPKRIIELNCNQLLRRLCWEDVFEFKNRHKFRVEKELYTPIKETVERLKQIISTQPGGYIALLGTPGSGKSTLLSETLPSIKKSRVIEYYAYLPDYPSSMRGESANFLHDMVLALHKAGFLAGSVPGLSDRNQLLHIFHKQIQLLHNDWKKKTIKTLILVDGLDHIEREQDPQNSMLLDLPSPDLVPEGVYFILGSQTDQLQKLPSRVQNAIRQSDRRVEMQGLSRVGVKSIIKKAGLAKTLSSYGDQIYQLSEGHPLALRYLLKHLEGKSAKEDIEGVLRDTPPYDKTIENQYHSYWRQIEEDHDLIHLLGLITRLRKAIDLTWIEKWYDPTAVRRFRRLMAHYFREEEPSIWSFFHNSFRLFLIDRTAKTTGNVKLHKELAEKCSNEANDSPWAWERLYHLFAAEEHDEVLRLATQIWFREQFLAFRPVHAITEDITYTVQSAAVRQDPVAITRLMLIGTEIYQRSFNLGIGHVLELLLWLDEPQRAVSLIREGSRLLINDEQALRVSVLLKEKSPEEAERIFKLAEPIDLLTDFKPIEEDFQREKSSLLKMWVRSAIHFYPIERIIKKIRQIKILIKDPYSSDLPPNWRPTQNTLLFHAGLELLNQGRRDELLKVLSAFDLSKAEDANTRFWLHVHSWLYFLPSSLDDSKYFLNETLKNVNSLELNNEGRLILAEGIYRILGDKEKAQELLQNVPQPRLVTDFLSDNEGIEPFLYRFRLNRLLYVFGNNQPPEEIIPDPQESRDYGMVLFERAIVEVAKIWADAWRGEYIDAEALQEKVINLVRFYYRDWTETRHWTSWFNAKNAADEFYGLLIHAVEQHGAEAQEALLKIFESEWENSSTRSYWPINTQRQIILKLHQWWKITKEDWTINKLLSLEEDMFEGLDISAKLEECWKQAHAWLSIGDEESARKCLNAMMRFSLGVGYRKDYQLDKWIGILGEIVKKEPDSAGKRILWFARSLVPLKNTTEGRAPKYAGNELLRLAFRWSPRHAVCLLNWFYEHEITYYEEAISIIMEEALRSNAPPTDLLFTFIKHILIPIARDSYPELVALLVEVTDKKYGIDRANLIAQKLFTCIDIHALPSQRQSWKWQLDNVCRKLDLNLDSDFSEPEAETGDTYSSQKLRLKSEIGLLSLDEVKRRVASISDLRKLVEDEDKDSYFDWVPVIEHVVKSTSRKEEFDEIVNIFEGKSHLSLILAVLCKNLFTSGYHNEAIELGYRALKISNVWGWDPHYDGGSRLSALEALTTVDPQKARPLSYDILAKDYVSEYREGALFFPSTIALNLKRVLSLLSEEIPWLEVWNEVHEYLKALFASYTLPEDHPWETEDITDNTPERAVLDLLMLHIDSLMRPFVIGSQRACVELLIQRHQKLLEILAEYIESNEFMQERILMILDSASLEDPESVSHIRDRITPLCKSPNYVIRKSAENILSRINSDQENSYGST